jgi:hypothetical protein
LILIQGTLTSCESMKISLQATSRYTVLMAELIPSKGRLKKITLKKTIRSDNKPSKA